MNFILTTEQMKQAEQEYAANSSLLSLMKNAGNACFKKINEIVGSVKDKGFVVLCGRGNNGGDGIVISALINTAGGFAITVFADDLPKSETARKCYNEYEKSINKVLYSYNEEAVNKAISGCDVIIDCVFGTGFTGELSQKLSDIFELCKKSEALKISIDIPSGCNADTGEIAPKAFKPNISFALAAIKVGMVSHPCFEHCGNIILLDIQLPEQNIKNYEGLLTDKSVLGYIPERPKSANKGTFGNLLNVCGSSKYPGAALLSSKAALRIGTGIVTIVTTKFVARSLVPAIPEAVYLPQECDDNGALDFDCLKDIEVFLSTANAVAIGCGLSKSYDTRKIVEFVLEEASCPIILDADGINAIADNINVLKDNENEIIITPHPGEFSRLTGLTVEQIQANRINAAKDFATKYGITVLLKGVNTVIATKTGAVFVNTTGNPGLARAGSGDVLTGIIAGLTAQGVHAEGAAILGAYLHGLAADELAKKVSLYGILPSDVADILPLLFS